MTEVAEDGVELKAVKALSLSSNSILVRSSEGAEITRSINPVLILIGYMNEQINPDTKDIYRWMHFFSRRLPDAPIQYHTVLLSVHVGE